MEVRQETLLTTIFADNSVICSESRDQEESLERWKYALERSGRKVRICKYVNDRETVKLQGAARSRDSKGR